MITIASNIHLDEHSNILLFNGDRRPITEKEKRLLMLLIEYHKKNEVLSRSEIIDIVWKERSNGVSDANLLQLVCKLRRTLNYCSLNNCIQTIPRKGYTFTLQSNNAIQPEKVGIKRDTFQNMQHMTNNPQLNKLSYVLCFILLLIYLLSFYLPL